MQYEPIHEDDEEKEEDATYHNVTEGKTDMTDPL